MKLSKILLIKHNCNKIILPITVIWNTFFQYNNKNIAVKHSYAKKYYTITLLLFTMQLKHNTFKVSILHNTIKSILSNLILSNVFFVYTILSSMFLYNTILCNIFYQQNIINLKLFNEIDNNIFENNTADIYQEIEVV